MKKGEYLQLCHRTRRQMLGYLTARGRVPVNNIWPKDVVLFKMIEQEFQIVLPKNQKEARITIDHMLSPMGWGKTPIEKSDVYPSFVSEKAFFASLEEKFQKHKKEVEARKLQEQQQQKCRENRNKFYDSDEWRRVRYQALKLHGGKCQCCGSRKGPLHVDHIKPRSKYPALELDINNLQVLCRDCNLGKSAWDETDWRQSDNVSLPA